MVPAFFCARGELTYRCGQPGQQQGRRWPSDRFSQPCLMRLSLVADFLAEVIQQIHSLRARGVMSRQVSRAEGVAFSAVLRSSGRSWTTPAGICFKDKKRSLSAAAQANFFAAAQVDFSAAAHADFAVVMSRSTLISISSSSWILARAARMPMMETGLPFSTATRWRIL